MEQRRPQPLSQRGTSRRVDSPLAGGKIAQRLPPPESIPEKIDPGRDRGVLAPRWGAFLWPPFPVVSPAAGSTTG